MTKTMFTQDEAEFVFDFDSNIGMDAEHWITTGNGSHLLIEGGGQGGYTVVGGAGGALNGKTVNPSSMSKNRINEKTSSFHSPEFKPHEPEKKEPQIPSGHESLYEPPEIKRETDKAYGVSNPHYESAKELHAWGGNAEVMRRGSEEEREAWRNNQSLKWLPKSHTSAHEGRVISASPWLAQKAGFKTKENIQKNQERFNAGVERYNALLEKAKAAGVKGVRSGMRTATIKDKMREAGIAADIFAFDKSARLIDPDGRMQVQSSNISKAMVCPYMGAEIPDAPALGLDPSKVYYLFRDPDELAKAAPTFKNLPLLIQHVPVTADEPRRDLVVGSTGSDVEFVAPYLRCSLAVWDAQAIAGIESKDQAELSSAYRYRADMTPGVYEGSRYDGIMRDIVGNHVALVDVGRAGPDVVVADQNPFSKDLKMTQKQRLIAAKVDARKALSGKIAQDADLADLDKVLDALIGKEDENLTADEADDELYEDDPDNPGKRRKKVVAATDADEDETTEAKAPPTVPPEVTKTAMDSAIAAAVAKAKAETKAEVEALHIARKEVSSMVGEIALDSAEAVYKFALDHAQVDTQGVHPSAYRAMVKLAQSKKAQPSIAMGMDAEVASKVTSKFPALSRFNHVI